MDNENEIWKDIDGFEGLYQASSEGRIRSLDREVAGKAGSVRILKGKLLKPGMDKDGYLQAKLSKEGKIRTFKVHRLVYAAFNGEIPNELQINHIDEDKTNNRLENLNLMTPKQNANWATRNERVGKAVAKANINNPLRSKPVIALDDSGNVVFQFPSTMEAVRNGFDQGHLISCCLGKRKHHRGYRWRYKEDIENA